MEVAGPLGTPLGLAQLKRAQRLPLHLAWGNLLVPTEGLVLCSWRPLLPSGVISALLAEPSALSWHPLPFRFSSALQ